MQLFSIHANVHPLTKSCAEHVPPHAHMRAIQRLGLVLGALSVVLSLYLGRFEWGPSCVGVSRWLQTYCNGANQAVPDMTVEAQSTHSEQWSFPDDFLALVEQMVRIPSISGSEQRVALYVQEWILRNGFNVSLQKVQPLCKGCPHRFNVLALPPALPISQVRVVLCTHLDTVPGGPDFRTHGDQLFGRGVVDAKSQAAAMMIAATRSLRDEPVALLLVCGEETDHAGMKAASLLAFSSNISLINGEPTESKICSYQKGMLKMRISASGVACHSGYPHLGSSAILKLLDALTELRSIHWPADASGETTMNIGQISGGEAPNIVPQSASAVVMFRLTSSPQGVQRTVESVVRARDNVTCTVLTRNAPIRLHTPPNATSRFGSIVVAYNTDVSYFSRPYEKAVVFGAGSIEVAHTGHESIATEELLRLPAAYSDIAQELLNSRTSGP